MLDQYEFYTDARLRQAPWILSKRAAAEILQDPVLNLQEMVSEQWFHGDASKDAL